MSGAFALSDFDVKKITARGIGDLPFAWCMALDSVQEIDADAIIAGGALRDFDHDVEIKDLDIFISCDVDLSAVKAALKSVYTEWVDSPEYEGADKLAKKPIKGCAVGSNGGKSLPVNLIKVGDGSRPAERVMNNFDFGICQIMFNGRRIICSDAYSQDRDRHEFTLIQCETHEGFKRSYKRYQRLVAKYPGYPLVVPEQFTKLIFPEAV